MLIWIWQNLDFLVLWISHFGGINKKLEYWYPTNVDKVIALYNQVTDNDTANKAKVHAIEKISPSFTQRQKLDALLGVDVKAFNRVVFEMLKETDYPVGKLDSFELVENDEVLKGAFSFSILAFILN